MAAFVFCWLLHNFNPRPPWGGRHVSARAALGGVEFQSTPSVGRATVNSGYYSAAVNSFQSTPSVGRATLCTRRYAPETTISIHALRGEGDFIFSFHASQSSHFNPRPPWGGRPDAPQHITVKKHFNPRPPWGGRQERSAKHLLSHNFNPRPPWGGRRCADKAIVNSHHNFNPRPPWGGRQRIQVR